MNGLENVRAEIDAIDDELVGLFLKRMDLVGRVAASKRERGAAITDPARERQILARVGEEVGPERAYGAELFFSTLFSISKARQRAILGGEAPVVQAIRAAVRETPFPARAFVACCGAEGAYAQQAVSHMFRVPTILYFTDAEKVFDAVAKDLCPYGVVPIENAAAGSVASVYARLRERGFHIVRALRLKVDHVLLANPGTRLGDVREVLSHPQALAQCERFFRDREGLRTVPTTNTALGAKALAANPRSDAAVIASRACAELYGLDVLAEGIQDAPHNYTRFVCFGKGLEIYPDAGTFTLALELPHRPGALHALLAKFAAIDVNVSKIESRPVPGLDFEYRFVLDCEARAADPAVLAVLAELSRDPDVTRFTFLGAYAER